MRCCVCSGLVCVCGPRLCSPSTVGSRALQRSNLTCVCAFPNAQRASIRGHVQRPQREKRRSIFQGGFLDFAKAAEHEDGRHAVAEEGLRAVGRRWCVQLLYEEGGGLAIVIGVLP